MASTKKIKVSSVELSDGNLMPLLGYGTNAVSGDKNDINDPTCQIIIHAIKCGYRSIDTAARYQNEEFVGNAIKYCIDEGIVKREELFICTKVWCTFHKRASVVKSARESLARLKLDYVDLLLVHWPMGFKEDGDPCGEVDPKTGKVIYSDVPLTETWQGMEDAKDLGLTKSIGVSNFNHKMCDELLSMCKHRPVVNQVECHLYLNQEKLLEYSKKHGIVLTAYCPLGSPGSSARPDQPWVLKDEVVAQLTKKYNKSAAQILLRFLVQRNISAIPKSVTMSRVEENLDVFDFNIDQADMERLLAADKNLRYCTTTGGYACQDHPLYPFHIEY